MEGLRAVRLFSICFQLLSLVWDYIATILCLCVYMYVYTHRYIYTYASTYSTMYVYIYDTPWATSYFLRVVWRIFTTLPAFCPRAGLADCGHRQDWIVGSLGGGGQAGEVLQALLGGSHDVITTVLTTTHLIVLIFSRSRFRPL